MHKDCSGNWYCNKWRICERCARRRSAQLADRADYLERRHGKLLFARATPEYNTQSCMRSLRDRVASKAIAPSGIWTIETGDMFAKLHLNLLIPENMGHATPEIFDYIEPVRTSARTIAAYISKRSGMPLREQYSGRLTGEWGTITQHILKDRSQDTTTAQAAWFTIMLADPERKKYVPDRFVEQQAKMDAGLWPPREKSREEYAEIARRNLANIYRICAKQT